jgi:hypothetical protein
MEPELVELPPKGEAMGIGAKFLQALIPAGGRIQFSEALPGTPATPSTTLRARRTSKDHIEADR